MAECEAAVKREEERNVETERKRKGEAVSNLEDRKERIITMKARLNEKHKINRAIKTV